MSTLVLEIGSEEVPARFLEGEKTALETSLAEALKSLHLAYGSVKAYATPRRASVVVKELASVQEVSEEVVSGPPIRIAYDAQGHPTKALQGFLKTQGVSLEEVFELKTDKGVYVAAKRKQGGRLAKELLAEILPDLILSLPFPKKMRWGSGKLAYARPLHWILALLDQEVVPFSLGDLESGRETYGHRIHGRGPFVVTEAENYFEVLKNQAGIILDSLERRKVIQDQGNALASKVGGQILWKDSLLSEVEGLVEHPVPVLGNFDPSYLEVPREVLLSSMEGHQKSFGVEDSKGCLLPYFLTVLNLDPKDLSLVQKGWERVLHARLEDARFFYREDLKANFSSWLTKLDQVIFIGPLGSMGDKTRRLEELTAYLALEVGEEKLEPYAKRVGRLSKADLVSGMVGEFDTLQGIMGGIYAKAWAEAPQVASALQEQYLPAGPESPLPKTKLGALLSIADKADTLAGCFGLNKIPTGTADPNGLRRCALGIIRITQAFGFKIKLGSLCAHAYSLYGERAFKLNLEQTQAKLLEFFNVRLQNYLQSLGYNLVTIEALLKAGFEDIPDVFVRLKAFTSFQALPDYVEKVQLLKRIGNILQKQGQELKAKASWSRDLFEHESEKELALQLEEGLKLAAKDPDYSLRLNFVATLRPYVNAFFDSVMVMAEDPKIRQNRLALLRSIADIYAPIVDFSALQI
ncbi:MAG: glycine--tRNA ligase subunit beta [Desulfovibrionaceae bacterium]|nr:glycine--tRNA ligase subunit beta [Desulfovibrionaceae bacterium]